MAFDFKYRPANELAAMGRSEVRAESKRLKEYEQELRSELKRVQAAQQMVPKLKGGRGVGPASNQPTKIIVPPWQLSIFCKNGKIDRSSTENRFGCRASGKRRSFGRDVPVSRFHHKIRCESSSTSIASTMRRR
jgi:hypothetical protein